MSIPILFLKHFNFKSSSLYAYTGWLNSILQLLSPLTFYLQTADGNVIQGLELVLLNYGHFKILLRGVLWGKLGKIPIM